MEVLMKYHWPGNVRELGNAMERAAILEGDEVITPSSLPGLFPAMGAIAVPAGLPQLASLQEVEKEYIASILKETKGNRTQAAKILGIDRKTLYQKLKKIHV
jgi:two-component system response regulator HydG